MRHNYIGIVGWSRDVELSAYVLNIKGAIDSGKSGLLHKLLLNMKVQSAGQPSRWIGSVDCSSVGIARLANMPPTMLITLVDAVIGYTTVVSAGWCMWSSSFWATCHKGDGGLQMEILDQKPALWRACALHMLDGILLDILDFISGMVVSFLRSLSSFCINSITVYSMKGIALIASSWQTICALFW